MRALRGLRLVDRGDGCGRNRIARNFFRRGVFDGQRCSRFGRLLVHTAPAIRAALAHRLAYGHARRATCTRFRFRSTRTAGLSFFAARARVSAAADLRSRAAARPRASRLATTVLRCGATGSTAAAHELLVLLAATLAANTTARSGRQTLHRDRDCCEPDQRACDNVVGNPHDGDPLLAAKSCWRRDSIHL